MPAVLRTMGLAENTLPSHELAAFENWGQACLYASSLQLKVQYVVLGRRGPCSATFPNRCHICSLIKIRQKPNVSDDLLISLLPYDDVSTFLLLVKAGNSSLLAT